MVSAGRRDVSVRRVAASPKSPWRKAERRLHAVGERTGAEIGAGAHDVFFSACFWDVDNVWIGARARVIVPFKAYVGVAAAVDVTVVTTARDFRARLNEISWSF